MQIKGENLSSIDIRDFELIEEIKNIINVIAHWMAIPLFLLFWIADILNFPEQKWLFLGIRLLIIPICFITIKLIRTATKPKYIQLVGSFYVLSTGAIINLLIYNINDPNTSYYAGLNLIAIGGLSFIPFTLRYYIGSTIGLYLPYFLISLPLVKDNNDIKIVATNTFFIVGSIVICFLIRFFNENLRIKEINSRLALKMEIANRDITIQNKTDESVKLSILSTQFSPQVVHAIKNGEVDLDKGVHRSKICAIFVDIVGSTDRVVRLDQQKVDIVLAKFMDTVVSTFLKYDLTIDKFQGDGILAFSNDPIRHKDFIQRTCLAAIEVMELLKADRDFYIIHWKKEMQVRIGISSGYANVGFYGNKKFFRTYTAIGAPLPFASRLTNLAEPNQILIDSDIATMLIDEGYIIEKLGVRTIKGFEGDDNIIFELKDRPLMVGEINSAAQTCPHHPESVLYLDTDDKGHFVMKCRQCDYIHGSSTSTKTRTQIAS